MKKASGTGCWAVVALVALLALAVAATPGSASSATGDQQAVAAKKKKKKADIPLGHWSGMTAQGTALSFTIYTSKHFSEPPTPNCTDPAFGTTRCIADFTFTLQASCSGTPRTFAQTVRYPETISGRRNGSFSFYRAGLFPVPFWYELDAVGTVTSSGAGSGTIRVYGDDPENVPGGPCESGLVPWTAHRG